MFSFRFETPWAFLAFLALLLLWLWPRFRGHRRAAVSFSSVSRASRSGLSWRQRFLWLPAFCRILAIVLLIFALARPQAGREVIHDVSQGIAIEMVLDRSGSMGYEMEFEGRTLNRLETAKEMFRRFVFGHGRDLPGRPNDLIGMIAFARYADTVCPLTLSHAVLKPFLEPIKLAEQEEDGTAIGDAVALAAARLHTAEETIALQTKKDKSTYQLKSKIIILLTDGENNCGRRSVAEAADLAAQWGIKVYAIAVGGGETYQVISTPLGQYREAVPAPPLDTRQLEDLAKKTGGLCRLATNGRSLQAIYEEIDRLERSDVESVRMVNYKELYQPFAMAGFLLLALSHLMTATWFRRIP